MRELISDAVSALYDNHIILLVSKAKKEPLIDEQESRLTSFLKLNNLKIGVSDPFLSPSDLKHYFRQASQVIIYGNKLDNGKQIYHYSEYLTTYLLDVCAQAVDLTDFCHPVILSLDTSARPADHDLLDTLYYYLFYAKDITKICDKLHVQRSTLFYRINKLRELINGNIEEGETTLHLLLSFKILEFLRLR